MKRAAWRSIAGNGFRKLWFELEHGYGGYEYTVACTVILVLSGKRD